MQLFSGSSDDFVTDAIQHELATKMGQSFYDYYRYRASVSESTSWQNSLTALANQFKYARMARRGIVLEFQLPQSSARLDAFIFGRSRAGADRAVLVELKQWSSVKPSEWDRCVESFVGGAERRLLHPCVQAQTYAQYLEGMHTAFHPGPDEIAIDPCAWLHNMHPGAADALRDERFTGLLAEVPLFLSNDADRFRDFFADRIGDGDGVAVMNRALAGTTKPSPRLLEHTAAMIAGEPRYRLIDEQIVAYEAVLAAVRRATRSKKHGQAVVVVTGGPGTGKSVIALNLLGALSKMGAHAEHATGSRAFTENLRSVLGPRARAQVRYFNNYRETEAGSIDVLIADEAHRIRKTSNDRFTPKAKRSDRDQIDELLDAAKVGVFFLDDHQAVRPNEVGGSVMLREAAVARGARFEQIDLRTQFRCAGSDAYIDWLDQLLAIRKTGQTTVDPSEYRLDLVGSAEALDAWIRERIAEGAGARLMAGFCWKWSSPDEAGRLVDDVVIDEFRRPWNAKPDAKRLAPGIPSANFWATDPGGVDQVGCIYTAQGFEFDYGGVVMGPDLVWRDGAWVGQPAMSCDTGAKRGSGPRFTDIVKNAYRVLLTRGIRGTALFVMDDETREHIAAALGHA